MDSTNGPSEKNQPKKRVDVNLEKRKLPSGMQKMDLSDLPLKMQEDIREMMYAFGMSEPPSIFSLTVPMEMDLLQIDLLANEFKDAILEDRYEDAENLAEEIKKRNYTIDITEKMISLTYKK